MTQLGRQGGRPYRQRVLEAFTDDPVVVPKTESLLWSGRRVLVKYGGKEVSCLLPIDRVRGNTFTLRAYGDHAFGLKEVVRFDE